METIQIWPNGRSVTYQGSYPHYRDESGAEFPPDEQRAIHAQVLASMYAQNDIFCCQSSLVSELMEKESEGFGVDDIENVYRDFSGSYLSECREYLSDIGGDNPEPDPWAMSRDELAELLGDAGIEVYDSESEDTLRAAVIANIDDETIDGLDDWREAANELAQDNPAEPYEWYCVSQWLCDKLRGIGEVVIDNDFGCWWGRTCTGQGLIMDGTLQEIALRILSK